MWVWSERPSGAAELWLKLEAGNPTGSYKDRMAVSVLTQAMHRGTLEVGDRVVEYTGGSTGTAFAFASSVLGLKFTAVFSKAIRMCRRLASELGVFCDVSTGLNVVAALDLAKELKSGQRVVTFGCDNGVKYLSGGVYA